MGNDILETIQYILFLIPQKEYKIYKRIIQFRNKLLFSVSLNSKESWNILVFIIYDEISKLPSFGEKNEFDWIIKITQELTKNNAFFLQQQQYIKFCEEDYESKNNLDELINFCFFHFNEKQETQTNILIEQMKELKQQIYEISNQSIKLQKQICFMQKQIYCMQQYIKKQNLINNYLKQNVKKLEIKENFYKKEINMIKRIVDEVCYSYKQMKFLNDIIIKIK